MVQVKPIYAVPGGLKQLAATDQLAFDAGLVTVAPSAAAGANTLASILAGGSSIPAIALSRFGDLKSVLNINQTAVGSIAGSSQLNKWIFSTGGINTGTGDGAFGFHEPFVVEHHYGGVNHSGGVNSFSVYSYRDAATPANNNNNNYVGATFTNEAIVSDGGSDAYTAVYGGSTGLVWQSGAKGAHFGANIQVGLRARATNIFNSTGCEFNVYSGRNTAQMSTTAGSTTATYSSLVGEGVAVGQDIVADPAQVPPGTTVTAFTTSGSVVQGTITLSQAALKTSTQAIQLLPTVYYKSIIQLTSRADDYVKGKFVDAMISMSGQGNARQTYGLLFGAQNGGVPLEDYGTVIGTLGGGTVAFGLDLAGYSVTQGLVRGRNTLLAEGFLALTGVNASIEIGSTATAGIAFLDFHSSGANNDYDFRVQANGGVAGAVGSGTLGLYGAAVLAKKGTNAASTGTPGNFAVTVFNAVNNVGENGMLVTNQWGVNTSTIFEVGLSTLGGSYGAALRVTGDRKLALWDGSNMSVVAVGAAGSGPGGSGRALYLP